MGGHEWKEPRKAKRERGGKLREQRELGDKGVEHKGMEKRTHKERKKLITLIVTRSYKERSTPAIVIFFIIRDQKYRQHVLVLITLHVKVWAVRVMGYGAAKSKRG